MREEIELAKAEVTEKATRLIKGAVVGIAAGIFVVTAIIFALIGCAWLLDHYLPGNDFTYFWGFFAMAVILLLLGAGPPACSRRKRQTRSAADAEHGDRGGAEDPRDGQQGDRPTAASERTARGPAADGVAFAGRDPQLYRAATGWSSPSRSTACAARSRT